MRTKWVAWVFHREEFSKAVKEAVASMGSKDVAQLMEVSVTTVTHWAAGRFDAEYPHPSMTNFLLFCNLVDRAPSDFFTTEG